MPDPAVVAAVRSIEAQAAGRTPEQQARYLLVTARNAAIQAAGPRPADGVCFGKKPSSRGGNGGE